MVRINKLRNEAKRANIIFDGVTYESRSLDPLIEPSKEHFQSIMACLPEAREAPKRAFNRAIQSTYPVDKGRFVNTEALISGHKVMSGRELIDNAPTTASRTRLINTYAPGTPEFGSISHEKTGTDVVINIRITNLKTACEYFGKQNLNPMAKMRQEIYSYKNEKKTDTFQYNNYHKARSLLSLASLQDPKNSRKKAKALEFGEPPYMRIKLAYDDSADQYRFDISIINEQRYNAALNPGKAVESAVNADLLKEVIIQAKIYNKMGVKEVFEDKSVNEKIIHERQILGRQNLEKEHLSSPFKK